ncbi:MAG TPA: hypothetical protein VHV51_17630, partial [Polyangiaceae bacterium]|nr:hypothetical protein [Polyangiaceae bacterium]
MKRSRPRARSTSARRDQAALVVSCALGFSIACNGAIGGPGAGARSGPGSSSAGSTATAGGSGTDPSYAGSSSTLNPGGDPVQPFQPNSVFAAVRKVKNLLTGLAPTDDEVASVQNAKDQAAAIGTLIDGWTNSGSAATYSAFHDKMVGFF